MVAATLQIGLPLFQGLAGTVCGMDHWLRREYLKLLRSGMTRSRAATLLGVTNMTVREVMKRDRRFAEDVEQILAERNDDVEEALLKTALSGNVEAQKFWLTNRDEMTWANRSRVEHTGRHGGPIEIATQATLALRNALLDEQTRGLAIDYVDAELVAEPVGELGTGGDG